MKKSLALTFHLQKQSTMSNEEREEYYHRKRKELHALEVKVEHFFEEKRSFLDKRVNEITTKLHGYFRSEVEDKICNIDIPNIAVRVAWSQISSSVKRQLYKNILEHIHRWESDHKEFENLGEEIKQSFTEAFPRFDSALLYLLSQSITSNTLERKARDLDIDKTFYTCTVEPRHRHSWMTDFIRRWPSRASIGDGLEEVSQVIQENIFFKMKFEEADYMKRQQIIIEYTRKAYHFAVSKPKLQSILEDEINVLYSYFNAHENKILNEVEHSRSMFKDHSKITSDMAAIREESRDMRLDLLFFHEMCFPSLYAAIDNLSVGDDFSVHELVASGVFSDVFKGATRNGKLVFVRRSSLQVKRSDISQYIFAKEVLEHR